MSSLYTLRADNISKEFSQKTVLKNVSLRINEGQIVGLLGPNGAGKTTLFYIILGLIPSNFGKIFLNEHEITNMPIYKRAKLGLGFLPQEVSIFRKMNVEENIKAILEIKYNNDSSTIKKKLEELLEAFNIGHLRKNIATSLSGGERRRVEIARALAINPKFILLDEPFAGVDPIAVIEIQEIMRFLKNKNIGILITDHNVRETLSVCDWAYIINKGVVFAQNKTEELVKDEKVKKIYLGENFTLN